MGGRGTAGVVAAAAAATRRQASRAKSDPAATRGVTEIKAGGGAILRVRECLRMVCHRRGGGQGRLFLCRPLSLYLIEAGGGYLACYGVLAHGAPP